MKTGPGRKPTWYLADNPGFAAWLRAELGKPPSLIRQSAAVVRRLLLLAGPVLGPPPRPLASLAKALGLPREAKAALLLRPSPPPSPRRPSLSAPSFGHYAAHHPAYS